ncbi:MAG: hypothetical protein AB8H47_25990 [Bacteroidia bacterium]
MSYVIRFRLLFCLLLPLWGTLSANVAMPGIYNAGGASGFQLLFPEDSLSFATIEMNREQVVAQLYPGFAVIKGTYWLTNPTADTLSIHMGYPINGIYEASRSARRFAINFDDLYAMKVYADGQKMTVYQEEHREIEYAENWYLWQQKFAPDTTTKIEVFFMVNTNDANILEGYTKDYHNAFLYILESGRAWAGQIGQGEIVVQIMPPLQGENIWGAMPDSGFVYNPQEQILIHRFSNWEPAQGENIGIIYGERLEEFDFVAQLENAESYFDLVERLALRDLRALQTEKIGFESIYKVHSFNSMGFVMGFLSFGIPLFVIFMIILVLRAIYRKISKKA